MRSRRRSTADSQVLCVLAHLRCSDSSFRRSCMPGPRGGEVHGRLEFNANEEGDMVSQQASPRGTFRKIADTVRAHVEADEEITELPSAAELMRAHGVSRGVALRVFGVLQEDGLVAPVPGGRWRVIRPGEAVDRRPLNERLADVITDDDLAIGARFPSTTALSSRFGVSRPTVSKALEKLEAAGLLSEARQGKQRTVRALPKRTESPES
ncbi:GntR family transcriptional regulator [Streptomyces sp. NPDC050421]|uniref:GntR family transcriptional regulator n=1 Tax=Streptomyces sp. NPDC050421 TaxID=3365613 RepID=UPI0037A53725